jgi:hypothetical protein
MIIKPCPCCGRIANLGNMPGPINIDTGQIVIMYYIFCHCGIKTIEFVSQSIAIAVWNNRA